MAEKNSNLGDVMESLFRGMDSFVTAKTVVGEAVQVKDTIILPLVDVSFGVGAGAGINGEKKSDMGGGGLGAKLSPSAVLVIQNGVTRLVNVRNQDTVTKVLDMVPEVIDRFTAGRGGSGKDPEVEKAVKDAMDGDVSETGEEN
ncbi:MAG: GerW family sporulation protein [Lachnospiraceae bacterium]|nr:GerW family sporulation protein [Lachnospiraceae bacterium]